MSANRLHQSLLWLAILLMASLLTSCQRSDTESVSELLMKGRQAYYDSNIIDALYYLQTAMTAAQAVGDEEAHFAAGVYMVMTYELTGRSEDAYNLLKTLNYLETKDIESYASQYYYRMKALFLAKIDHDYAASVDCCRRVIELDRRLYPNDTAFVFTELSNLGETYLMAGDYGHVAETVDEIERTMPAAEGVYQAGYCYLKSSLLYHQGDLDAAYAVAQRGLQYCRKHDAADNEILQLRLLCSIDSMNDHIADYIGHRNQLDSLTAQLRGTQVNYQIAALKGKQQLEQKEYENRRSRTLHVVIIVAMVLVIVALAVTIGALRRNARTQRRMAEVERRRLDAEIARQQLEKELLDLKMRQNAEKLYQAYKNNVSMSQQIVELADNADALSKLHALEATLHEQQADFMERLRQRFPRLTDNDIRLAGFIRMNVKTQIIATALGISAASMNTARYRLRKKLGLQADDDLKHFIDAL